MRPARTISLPATSDEHRHPLKSPPDCQDSARGSSTSTGPAVILTAPYPAVEPSDLRTLKISIPFLHNPWFGLRLPVWPWKIRKTIKEIQARFSGLTMMFALGWCAEDGAWDPQLRVEIDYRLTAETQKYLAQWNPVLAERFKQREMYFQSSESTRLLQK